MIRLRHTLERARRHSLAGPLVLIVLLLLLVLVVLRTIHEGQPAAVVAAPLCLALLVITAVSRPSGRRRQGLVAGALTADRAPPQPARARLAASRGLTAPFVVPLRR